MNVVMMMMMMMMNVVMKTCEGLGDHRRRHVMGREGHLADPHHQHYHLYSCTDFVNFCICTTTPCCTFVHFCTFVPPLPVHLCTFLLLPVLVVDVQTYQNFYQSYVCTYHLYIYFLHIVSLKRSERCKSASIALWESLSKVPLDLEVLALLYSCLYWQGCLRADSTVFRIWT